MAETEVSQNPPSTVRFLQQLLGFPPYLDSLSAKDSQTKVKLQIKCEVGVTLY